MLVNSQEKLYLNSLEGMIGFIEMVYHASLRQYLFHIEFETLHLAKQYGKKFPEMQTVAELLQQFKHEVLDHMNREEHDFFPVLVQIEQCVHWLMDFTDCDLKKFEDVIRRLELDHENFDTYVMDLVKVFRASLLKYEDLYTYDHFHNYFSMLENETMRHTELENTKLHPLAKKLFAEVCHLK